MRVCAPPAGGGVGAVSHAACVDGPAAAGSCCARSCAGCSCVRPWSARHSQVRQGLGQAGRSGMPVGCLMPHAALLNAGRQEVHHCRRCGAERRQPGIQGLRGPGCDRSWNQPLRQALKRPPPPPEDDGISAPRSSEKIQRSVCSGRQGIRQDLDMLQPKQRAM